MPKPAVNAGNFAFDDDTSDSETEENLQSFKDNVNALKNVGDLEEDGCDEGDDESSESNMGSDSDDSEDVTDDEDDSEDVSDDDDDNTIPVDTISQVKRDQLSNLQNQLENMKDDSSNSDADDDSDHHENTNGNKFIVTDVDNCQMEKDDLKDSINESIDETNNTVGIKRKYEETVETVKETSEEKAKKKYREQLSQMSIEDIQKLKERLGLKLFNQKLSGTAPKLGKKIEFKRENKNRPREMSSKKTVGRFREVVPVTKIERRDPRFDPLCGEFDNKLFKESYQFVNEIKSQELVELKKQIKVEEDPEKRKSIKYLIQRMENQLRAEAQNKVREANQATIHAERKEQLKAGKKPFYESKSKQREAKLVEQYEELKQKGSLDTFIKKKTKKNLSNERRKGLGVT